MVVDGSVEVASSIVGVISPVLSAIILALVTYMIRKYLPENVRGEVEKSVSEAESEIKREIQNGITERLDTIQKHVTPSEEIKTTTVAPQKIDSEATHVEQSETPFKPNP